MRQTVYAVVRDPRLAAVCLTLLCASWAPCLDVLTVHYDNSRSCTNLSETTLSQANVAVGTFGKLYTRTIDAYTYAQPLYVSGVSIGGGTHNIVYVATEHNSVYAFDADDVTGLIPAYWSVNLGPSVPYGDVYTNGDTNITPEVGITGTPVIDKSTNTLYVVAFTKEAGPAYHQRLHALDLSTGAEKFGGPADITYSQTVAGHVITFNPLRANQRPGLALANGSVYIAWASFGDIGLGEPPETTYHGYIMRYSASTLAQQAVFVASPSGTAAGIWQVGCGPAVDVNGNIYVVTGNGTSDTDVGGINYGETSLKLTPNLGVADYFTPYNKDALNNADLDLGTAGHVLVDLPAAPVHKHLMIHGSKDGKLYVLDRDNMGHFHAGDDSNAVSVTHPVNDEIRATPVFWQSPSGPRIYVNGQGNGGLYAIGLNADGTPTTNAVAGAQLLDGTGFRGSHMSLSSNGAAAGSGVLWTFSPTIGDPIHAVGAGILRAFNAETLQELYNSQLNPTRDSIGNYPKYVPPLIANGRVYVPTFSGKLHVFGLVPTNPALTVSLTAPASGASYAEPASIPLAASASAGSASIAKIDFFSGTNVIGEVTAAPYGQTWTSVTAGTYTLRAVVTDSNGASATSGPVTITVSGSGGTGTILHQVWSNIAGTAVTDLTSVAGFPNNPTSQDQLTSFEGPTNVADNYGSRIVGYVYPPISGSYTFWIASDDNGELWLSSDDNPANKTRIATVTAWTNSEEWTRYPSQQSPPITLIGGQRYYVEALQKEGGGGDNLAVGWQLPNGQYERPILGAHLSPAPPAGSSPYGLTSRGALPGLAMPSDLSSPPPATLSATGVFANLTTLAPVSGIVPYTPNTPLWSDAAVKSRWIALPNNARIGFAATGEWTFPGGTVLIKHFELGTDDNNPGTRKRLETRLLVLDNTGANGYGVTYKWRADNSDADLVAAGGLDEDVTIANAGGGTRTQTWHYPSQSECLQCHTVNAGFVLGPKTRQLNGSITYAATGVTDNQLRTWNELRMFTTDIGEGNIAGFSRSKALSDSSATLEDRVKSYIDANCGQCHRPGGIAGWDARYDIPMASEGIIGATPVHGNLGVTGAQIVYPGDPTHSVLSLRMASLATGTKMPPLARNLVDSGALSVVNQWIGGLSGTLVGTGTGLTGQYWTNQLATFNGAPTLTRTDPTINFDWGGGSPDPSISVDHFTARWTGQVQAQFTETYTFYVTGDDGVRLWVNGAPIMNAWTDQGPTEYSGTIALTAGQSYSITLEYYEDGGGAVAKLAWASPSTPKQTVPQSQLYPAIVAQVPTSIAVAPANATVGTGAAQQFTAVAKDQNGVALNPQPAFAWTAGGGTISSSGVFTAGATAGGPFTVTASSGGVSGNASVTVIPVGTGLTGQYWTNQLATFNGAPTLTRIDPVVNFDWGTGSPDPSISVDHFTARWTGQVQAQFTETYTFSVTGDDGVRLWVNGQLIVDKWVDQAPTEWSGTIALTAGQRYAIQLDYYENGGGAVAKLAWASQSTPKQTVPQSQLYPTALVLTSIAVSPATATVLSGATQQFTAVGNDQNGVALVPQPTFTWSASGGAISGTGLFTAGATAGGPFTITASSGAVNGNASVTVTAVGTGLTGQYWTNQLATFTGAPTLTRNDPVVNFDWGTGSPDPSISVDHFTARWTGQVQAQFSETYTFYVTGDDGVRLWVNGQLLVNKWIDQGPTEWSGTIALTAGQRYAIQLDYYENGGGAVAKLAWSSPSTPKQTVPQSQLYPTAGPTNLAPVVNAGPDVAISLPATATLAGTASDDGVPGPLTVTWSVVSGPGPVAFANPAAAATTASFTVPGTYTLSLNANDGALASSDTAVVTVTPGNVTLTSGGTYTLAAVHSGKLLDVTGAGLADGTQVIQWDANSGLNQQWEVDGMVDGTWRVTSVNSGKVLEVAGASLADNAPVDQAGDTGAANQRWYITDAGNGTIALVAKHSGKRLDIAGSSLTSGANAVQNTASGAASQRWTPTLISAPPPASAGFTAIYYDNIDFTGSFITRVDPTINFNWGAGSPDPAIGVDTFSARWTAHVTPPTSEVYTFYTTTDDGVRLWVNGQLLIDKWVDQGPTTWTGTITLVAGQAVDLRMDFYENAGGAMAMLEWSSASTSRQVVPASAAVPAGVYAMKNDDGTGVPEPHAVRVAVVGRPRGARVGTNVPADAIDVLGRAAAAGTP